MGAYLGGLSWVVGLLEVKALGWGHTRILPVNIFPPTNTISCNIDCVRHGGVG